MTTELMTIRQRIYDDYLDERIRQEEKFPDQHLPDGTSDSAFMLLIRDAFRDYTDAAAREGTLTWRHVLGEEVAEAFAEVEPAKLRAELVQVMATAGRWIEDIDGVGA